MEYIDVGDGPGVRDRRLAQHVCLAELPIREYGERSITPCMQITAVGGAEAAL